MPSVTDKTSDIKGYKNSSSYIDIFSSVYKF